MGKYVVMNPGWVIIRQTSYDKWLLVSPPTREQKELGLLSDSIEDAMEKYHCTKLVHWNKNKAREKLNQLYKNYNKTWEYNGQTFQSQETFKEKARETYSSLPRHSLWRDGLTISSEYTRIVYYHGKVFYCYWSGTYDDRCSLYDIKTRECRLWTSIYNCAPVLCLNTGQYI